MERAIICCSTICFVCRFDSFSIVIVIYTTYYVLHFLSYSLLPAPSRFPLTFIPFRLLSLSLSHFSQFLKLFFPSTLQQMLSIYSFHPFWKLKNISLIISCWLQWTRWMIFLAPIIFQNIFYLGLFLLPIFLDKCSLWKVLRRFWSTATKKP